MTNDRFVKKHLDLKGLIPASHFRTIESFQMKKANSEIKVEIELKDDFMKELTFRVPWDGKLYAYYRTCEQFILYCREADITVTDVNIIFLEDWDDKFSVIIETVDRTKELSFYVKKEDVKYLLENCCRIPSQKNK